MRKCLIIAAAVVFANAFVWVARADCPGDVNDGVWSPARDFDSSLAPSLGCTRKYFCNPAEQMIIDASCRVVATDPVSVGGVCSAGSGDPSSCNACLTSPPSDPCQWHLEQR